MKKELLKNKYIVKHFIRSQVYFIIIFRFDKKRVHQVPVLSFQSRARNAMYTK